MKTKIFCILVCITHFSFAQIDSIRVDVSKKAKFLRIWKPFQDTKKGDSIIRKFQKDNGRSWDNSVPRDYQEPDFLRLIQYLEVYRQDTMPEIKRIAYSYIYDMCRVSRDTMLKRKLMNICWEDAKINTNGLYDIQYNNLSDFDEELKDKIRIELQKKNPHKDVVLLVGFLQLKDQVPRLKEIIKNKEQLIYPKNYYCFYYSKMEAHFALANMGDKKEINKIVEIAKNNYYSIFLGKHLDNTSDGTYFYIRRDLPMLMYIRRPEIIDYFVWVMEKKDIIFPYDPTYNDPGLAYSITKAAIKCLVYLIDDFPFNFIYYSFFTDNSLDKNLVKQVKEWFEVNKRKYIIKKNICLLEPEFR